MQDELLRLIREMIYELEEEDLAEFSGVGAIAGATVPLGAPATYPNPKVSPKKRRIREASTVASGMTLAMLDLNNNGVPDSLETNHFRDRTENYESSVECLARAYGGAKSPFKDRAAASKFLQWKY